MRSVDSFPKVYLYRGRVDFRKWINGLVALIESQLNLSPSEEALFVFVSKDRETIKAVYWDKSGFCLWCKRLEKAKFPLPKREDIVMTVEPKIFEMFLDGFDILSKKPHEKLSFNRFS